jgi:hypothetical protein
MTTRDPRVDHLEGVLERIASEQTELRQDMRDLRSKVLTEIRSRLNTLLTVNLVMWISIISTLMGLFFTVG